MQLCKPVTAASRTIIKTGVSAGLTDTRRDKGLGPPPLLSLELRTSHDGHWKAPHRSENEFRNLFFANSWADIQARRIKAYSLHSQRNDL